jgi:hypothetical protein
MQISEFLYVYVECHRWISDKDVIKNTTSFTKQQANNIQGYSSGWTQTFWG